jgi:hypothetical protein
MAVERRRRAVSEQMRAVAAEDGSAGGRCLLAGGEEAFIAPDAVARPDCALKFLVRRGEPSIYMPVVRRKLASSMGPDQ